MVEGQGVQEQVQGTRYRDFRVVGIGASAGGLEALERMFHAMPNNSGMAFVIVQHLSPDFKSLMGELLSRRTRMTVKRVDDGMPLAADTVYLIPPRKNMLVTGGALRLLDQDSGKDLQLPTSTNSPAASSTATSSSAARR